MRDGGRITASLGASAGISTSTQEMITATGWAARLFIDRSVY